MKRDALRFLRKHQANPHPQVLGPRASQPLGSRPEAAHAHAPPPGCLATRRGCLATPPPRPAPASPSQPGPTRKAKGVVLPLFSSVLPRAGCREVAGGGERESSQWAGTAAAAPPASGVKERPWHPSPQGSVSSTLGNRARPAPTGLLLLPG